MGNEKNRSRKGKRKFYGKLRHCNSGVAGSI